MRTICRLAVVDLISTFALTVTAPPASASSNQSCSSRGKNNTTVCVVNINIQKVSVKINGNRILSNNEVGVLEDVITLNISRSLDQIIDAVVVSLLGFDNYSYSSACASKGKAKACR